MPSTANFVAGLFYRRTARYSEQLERYLQAFGRDQVLPIIFDDFTSDTAGVYADGLRFLGLPAYQPAGFDRINPNGRPRSLWLRELLMQPSPAIRSVGRTLPPRA